MYKTSLTLTDTHLGWQQRIKREMGSEKLYTEKAYADPEPYYDIDFSRRSDTKSKHKRLKSASGSFGYRTGSTWLSKTTAVNSQLDSSYPVPFRRINQNQRWVKQNKAYMSDATHSNPSDPNSMFDQGETRNCVYNVKFYGLPDGTAATYSKALGVHDKGSHNNTFYSFGARFTNISDHFDDESLASGRCQTLNKSVR